MSTATPLPHQVEAVDWLVELLTERNSAVDASVPGFGKTFVACFVAKRLGRKIAVLCPKVMIRAWTDAAAACGVEVAFVANYEAARSEKFQHGRWVIRGKRYEWMVDKATTLLVFDEAHRCKARTSQTSKLMLAAIGFKTLALSATLAQDPLDMYAVGGLLGLHDVRGFWGWAISNGVTKGRFAFEYTGGAIGLRALHAQIFPGRGHRASYDDIPGFPEHTVEAVGVPVDKPKLIDAEYARARELEAAKADATEAIVARLRARQVSELAKVPAMIELADDAIAEGMSVILFLSYHDSIEAARSRRAWPVISGRVSDRERQQAIADFQADRVTGIIVQVASGGVGISLHDTNGAHPRLALISPPDGARNLIQALGRHRRTGGKTPAFSKIVFAQKTVEERALVSVSLKAKQIDTLNDADLGA